jgi:hypothetical protein
MSEFEENLLELMHSEHKILQDKIDKIGGFRFTIRGWSVTIVMASIVAAGGSKLISPYLLGVLFIFIWVFYAVENRQNELREIFQNRAFYLERRLREQLRLQAPDHTLTGTFPGLAHHLHDVQQEQVVSAGRRWLTTTDRYFYAIQSAAVVVAISALVLIGKPTDSQAPSQTVIQINGKLTGITPSAPPPTKPVGQTGDEGGKKTR